MRKTINKGLRFFSSKSKGYSSPLVGGDKLMRESTEH